jgi:hypothetical protein
MSPTLITVLVLGVLIIIAAIAFALYKAGFRPTEINVKTGPLEAKMERTPAQPSDKETPPAEPAVPVPFSQEAISGSVIRKTSIKAPADSPASASQKAEDDSLLDDVHIKLT